MYQLDENNIKSEGIRRLYDSIITGEHAAKIAGMLHIKEPASDIKEDDVKRYLELFLLGIAHGHHALKKDFAKLFVRDAADEEKGMYRIPEGIFKSAGEGEAVALDMEHIITTCPLLRQENTQTEREVIFKGFNNYYSKVFAEQKLDYATGQKLDYAPLQQSLETSLLLYESFGHEGKKTIVSRSTKLSKATAPLIVPASITPAPIKPVSITPQVATVTVTTVVDKESAQHWNLSPDAKNKYLHIQPNYPMSMLAKPLWDALHDTNTPDIGAYCVNKNFPHVHATVAEVKKVYELLCIGLDYSFSHYGMGITYVKVSPQYPENKILDFTLKEQNLPHASDIVRIHAAFMKEAIEGLRKKSPNTIADIIYRGVNINFLALQLKELVPQGEELRVAAVQKAMQDLGMVKEEKQLPNAIGDKGNIYDAQKDKGPSSPAI